MAKNGVFPYTRTIPLPLPAGLAPGAPVKVGDIVGIVLDGTKPVSEGGVDGTTAAVAVDGVWNLTVTGAVTNVGSKVYLAADGSVTTTSTSNAFLGYAMQLKDAAASAIRVHIPGV